MTMHQPIVKRLLAFLSVTGLLVIATVLFFLHSNTGLNIAIDNTRHLIPGSLTFDKTSGTLAGPLTIEEIRWVDTDGTEVKINHLQLNWQISAMLAGRLDAVNLYAESVFIHSVETTESKPVETTDYSLPIDMTINQLQIDRIQIVNGIGSAIDIQNIRLMAEAEDSHLKLNELTASSMDTQLSLSGKIKLIPEPEFQLNSKWTYENTDLPTITGSGSIGGSLRELGIMQKLGGAVDAEMHANIFNLIELPNWQADIKLNESDISAFVSGYAAILNGELSIAGSPSSTNVSGELRFNEPTLGLVDIQIAASYLEDAIHIEQLSLVSESHGKVQSKGLLSLSSMNLESEMQWQDLRWHVDKKDFIGSPQGQITAKGTLENIHYSMTATLQTPQVSNVAISSTGDANQDGLSIDVLTASLLDGEIQAKGKVNWATSPAWNLMMNGQQINPVSLVTDLPGNLAFELQTQGELRETGIRSQVEIIDLHGQLRDYPARLHGFIESDTDKVKLKNVQLTSGRNQLKINGHISKQLSLNIVLEAPALNELWPGLDGALSLKGDLTGHRDHPALNAIIKGNELAYLNYRIKQLSGEVNLPLSDIDPIKLDVVANGLVYDELSWSKLSVSANGNRVNHNLDFALDGSYRVHSSLNGGFSNENDWIGTVNTLEIEESRIGQWRLQKATGLQLSRKLTELDQSCLESKYGQACLAMKLSASHGASASLKSEKLSLYLFNPWLPHAVPFGGHAKIDANISTSDKRNYTGKAELSLHEAITEITLGDQTERLDISDTRLQVDLSSTDAEGYLQIPIAGFGQIDGRLRFPGFDPEKLSSGQQDIDGEIRASITDISAFAALSPSLAEVSGNIQSDLKLTGKLNAPRVSGYANLNKGLLDIPSLGLRLDEISGRMESNESDFLHYEAAVTSGDGILKLMGSTELAPDKDWSTDIRIKGDNWQAVNLPEASVSVSPDLHLQKIKDSLKLAGEIRIPTARLRPRTLPASAVTNSDDLVVVRNNQPVSDTGKDPAIHSRIRLILGDKVNFEGFGLRARLSGDLSIIDDPGRPLVGNGTLSILDGTYKAYGQNLNIEHGRLIYAHTPIDNPLMDVRAVRHADSVTAGINVTGLIRSPKLTLFSSPPKSDTETLSYLLTGKPPSGGSGSYSGSALSAALAASGTSRLTDELARQLKLDELRVETGQNLQDASVAAGTWLNPRLYIEYVNELSSSQNKMLLRYDLNDRLQIQTESGDAQGIDLFLADRITSAFGKCFSRCSS